jgi:hypothetical protein
LKSEQPIKEGAYIIAKVDLENKIIMQHRTWKGTMVHILHKTK